MYGQMLKRGDAPLSYVLKTAEGPDFWNVQLQVANFLQK
jgi:hypothetical protein